MIEEYLGGVGQRPEQWPVHIYDVDRHVREMVELKVVTGCTLRKACDMLRQARQSGQAIVVKTDEYELLQTGFRI